MESGGDRQLYKIATGGNYADYYRRGFEGRFHFAA